MGDIIEARRPGWDFEDKIKAHKKETRIDAAILILSVLLAIIGTYLLVSIQTYTGYSIVNSYGGGEKDRSYYLEFADGYLKYSRDGISYLEPNGKEIWNQACQVSTPVLSKTSKTVILYDQGGNDILVMNTKGAVGEVRTKYPIEKAVVSENGIVGALMKNESTPLLVCYDSTGNVLVENRSSMTGTGYPVSMALSPDGKKMVVSYVCVQDGVEATRLVFYDFSGGAGDAAVVCEDIYKNTVIPISYYVNKDTVVLVADHQLLIYKGGTPSVWKRIDIDKEISSVFYSDEYLGFILKNSGDDASEIRVFDTYGVVKMSKQCVGDFNEVKISGGDVVLYTGKRCLIYSTWGICKFNGEMPSDILEIIPLMGINKYLIMNVDGVQEIRLVK